MPYKTLLPGKLEQEPDTIVLAIKLRHSINLLIDRVEELSEVVEGKECRHCEVAGQQGVTHIHTPTLKETLLKSLENNYYKIPRNSEQLVEVIEKADVEDVINRLIP